MMLIFEFSRQRRLKPELFRSRLGKRRYLRFSWLWFAVTYWPGDQHEFGLAVRQAKWCDE